MCHESPPDWARWLPLDEYWYNTTFHTAAKIIPYEIVYGQPPPTYRPYLPGSCMVDSVDKSLQQRKKTLILLKENLAKAQNRMVQLANRRRSGRQFNVNDWVYLKFKPYRQQSVEVRNHPKIAAKYFGSYQIIKKIEKVAYTLQLPASSKIHPTFYVLMLKPHYSPTPDHQNSTIPPPSMDEPVTPKAHAAVLKKRMVKRRNQAEVQWFDTMGRRTRRRGHMGKCSANITIVSII